MDKETEKECSMSKTIRQLIAEAQSDINTYRDPDISDFVGMMDKILSAAGLGAIGSDRVSVVTIQSGIVYIQTRYSVRGCAQSSSYEFPASILDAVDPVKAATSWGLERRLDAAHREVEETRRMLLHREEKLAKAKTALAAFEALKP